MRRLGIHYDIGTAMIGGGTTRPTLPRDRMEREIGDIAGGLHANAIRITGGRYGPDRGGRRHRGAARTGGLVVADAPERGRSDDPGRDRDDR